MQQREEEEEHADSRVVKAVRHLKSLKYDTRFTMLTK